LAAGKSRKLFGFAEINNKSSGIAGKAGFDRKAFSD